MAERELLARRLDQPASGQQTVFDTLACKYCGGLHRERCPRVKRIEFHPNEKPSLLEFFAWGEWPEERVIWPEEVFGRDYDDQEEGL